MNRSDPNLPKIMSQGPEKEQIGLVFFRSLLRAPTFGNLAMNRIASLQNTILLWLLVAILLDILFTLITWHVWDAMTLSILGVGIITGAFLTLALFLLRRGHLELVSWILVVTILLAYIASVAIFNFNILNTIEFAIFLTLTSVLLRPASAAITNMITLVGLAVFWSFRHSSEITHADLSLVFLALGLEFLLLTISSHALEKSFSNVDQSTQDLLQSNKNLQDLSTKLAAEIKTRERSEEETLRQNRLLLAAAEIAYVTTRAIKLDELLSTSVELIREKFDFYHVSLFLIEPDSDMAVVLAASGSAGHQLKVGEHKLAVGSKSLIGSATVTCMPLIVQDVTKEPIHLKNPTLPDTLSEAAIPLLIGDLVIGALDIQSTMVNAFSDWDITTLTTIANQLAIAVQNTRLYISIQQEVLERRNAEQALQFANEALELRVSERTAELKKSNDLLTIELNEREKSEALFKILFELSPDAILLIDPHDPKVPWQIVDCNTATCLMNGYSRNELIGNSIDILNVTLGIQTEQKAYMNKLREAGILKFENHHRRKNGDIFPIETSTSLITVGGRELIIGIDRDITERKRVETELEQFVSTLNATLEATADGILVVDGQGKIVNFNKRFTEIWNIPSAVMESSEEDKVMNFVLDQLVDQPTFVANIREIYDQVEVESFDMLLFKDGRVFERYSRPQKIAGKNVGRVWSFRDITKRKHAEDELIHSALHDPLTKLPNRVLFMDRLQHAMERARRHKSYKFAVIFLDLDRFKVVNDSLGHKAGDLLLIESANRLAACLRNEDTVARLGGDEFVILLEDVQSPMDATRVADRIQHDLALPYDLEGHKVFISASMGIALSADSYKQADEVLRDADIAMYRAKGEGRGCYEMFDTAMLARVMTHLELETDLRKALEHKEFVIHYQPIVELEAQHTIGFEALVRWQHPTRGLVPPAEFIPMAEETGLIVPIGQWVLTEACRQIGEWQVQFPTDPALTISVNLSVRQCNQTDFVEKVAKILKKTGLDASSLKLELTESMIVKDNESTLTMLSELRELGVQVQIDDFGTGYSSLGYLQRLPIDTLKIDRTFINRIGKDGSGSEIVRTILTLAHDLGMKVVAEGIETDEQLSKLIAMDCEYGQGFLFNKPVDSQMATKLLAKSFAGDEIKND